MKDNAGSVGERYAARYLEEKGYRILARNYRSRFGEIDLIAANSRYLVFAEVKTRRKGSMTGPLESVTAAKQRRLIRTALMYLRSFPSALQPRFDVIGLTVKDGSAVSVEHIEDAFDCGGFF